MMNEVQFPPGWDEAGVRRVLQHYEEQTDEEATVEDEDHEADLRVTVMEVPTRLVPAVRELIARSGP